MLSKLLLYLRLKHDHQFLTFEERSGRYHFAIFWGPQNEVFWYGPSRSPLGERNFLGEMHAPMSSSGRGPFAERIAEAVRDDPSIRTDVCRLFEKMKESQSELGETEMCKVYLARITTFRRELAKNPLEPSCCQGYDYPF
jgi:hypothetical protein